MDGANVDPSLSRIYVLSQMGSAYFSQVHGIDVRDWPDDLRVMADADPVFFSKVDGIDVDPWPDDLRILKDAGQMFYALIDGIDVDPWPETIRIMQGVGQTFGAAIDGILLKRYVMDFPRVMSQVGPIYGGIIRGAELGDPSIQRIDLATGFDFFRLPYYDAIELKRYVNDMMLMLDAAPVRGGILRGPELGIPSQLRAGLATGFKDFLLPYYDGFIIKEFPDSTYIMPAADPFRGGILRGPELGNPSQLRAGVAPFFNFEILPQGAGLVIKDFVNDMMVSSLYDAFRGGVLRGSEIGDPSEIRLIIDFDSDPFIILTPEECPEEAIILKDNVTDIGIALLEDATTSVETMFAVSNLSPSNLLTGFATDFQPETISYDTIFASSTVLDLLFNTCTDVEPFTIMSSEGFDSGILAGPSDKTISVTASLSPFTILKAEQFDGAILVGPSDKTISVTREFDPAYSF